VKAIPHQLLPEPGDDQRLYAAQPKVYPREIDGRFARLRLAAVFVLLGIFYGFPWLRWNGHQAVLFDLPARKFYVFGLTFWPQDFFWLAWLLIIAGLSLFFFTALAGRLWCGYACPQTVWTEVFLWIERACEGRRNARIKLDAGAWTREKLFRKGLKQTLWIAFALWTGFTFVGFFTPVTELAREVWTLHVSGWEGFWIVFYGFATYGNAGYLREQVCKYMCPYARFQSAMFDKDTLVVSYDGGRGEPRGPRRKGTRVLSRVSSPTLVSIGVDTRSDPHPVPSPDGRGGVGVDLRSTALPIEAGDCIDCDACVQVCPTGIDIRDGLQIECIACALCIDACDGVMDKMSYPRGLIRYTTENMLAGKPRRVLRPRTVLYGGVLAFLLLAFVWGVTQRAPLIVEVLRDRYALYRETGDGAIENSYTLKVANKSDHALHLTIAPSGDVPLGIVGRSTLDVGVGEVGSIPLTLRAAPHALGGKHRVELHVRSAEPALDAEYTTEFFAPEAR
jgi:polyferredoxin